MTKVAFKNLVKLTTVMFNEEHMTTSTTDFVTNEALNINLRNPISLQLSHVPKKKKKYSGL